MNNPLAKITGHPLNFEAATDPANPAGTKVHDGEDALFGDLDADWLVGGTDLDHLFGGRGNDILNVDDYLETSTTDASRLTITTSRSAVAAWIS